MMLDIKNITRICEIMGKASIDVGVSWENAAAPIGKIAKLLEFDPETEIMLIQLNPSLSIFQKWKLKRKICVYAKKLRQNIGVK